jgi:Co/Zn/Cd efflux system component
MKFIGKFKNYISLVKSAYLMFIEKFKNYNSLVKFALLTAFVGLVVFGLFLFYLNQNHEPSYNIDPEFTSMVGDFIGGVVGSIWAFASVLLFYAALKIQQEELRQTNLEMQRTNEIQ